MCLETLVEWRWRDAPWEVVTVAEALVRVRRVHADPSLGPVSHGSPVGTVSGLTVAEIAREAGHVMAGLVWPGLRIIDPRETESDADWVVTVDQVSVPDIEGRVQITGRGDSGRPCSPMWMAEDWPVELATARNQAR
jgi:hypothetical protein